MSERKTITTEEKVIKASLKEFAQHGYEGARIDRIAKNAKVNKAMIYYHFKGKEALYEKIISDTVNGLYANVTNIIPENMDPVNQLYSIVENYIRHITTIDISFVQLMLRELSSGGKYFRKIVLPSAILPLFGIINGIFDKGKKDGVMRDIIPHYTMFQVIGGIVFFNALRIVLQGTELQQFINNDKAIEEFSENFIGILKYGIEKKG